MTVGSFHPGGANVGFADGSVRFIKETIQSVPYNQTDGSVPAFSYGGIGIYTITPGTQTGVWQKITTRNFGEVISSDSVLSRRPARVRCADPISRPRRMVRMDGPCDRTETAGAGSLNPPRRGRSRAGRPEVAERPPVAVAERLEPGGLAVLVDLARQDVRPAEDAPLVSLDDQRRPLVDAQADQVGPLGEHAQQAVDPAPPQEVLVDDRVRDEPEAAADVGLGVCPPRSSRPTSPPRRPTSRR